MNKNIERDMADMERMANAQDITQFVIDYLKGRGAAYTITAARQMEKMKNVRFMYDENTSSILVDAATGASLNQRQIDALTRHEGRIIDQYEKEYGYAPTLQPYQYDYIMQRIIKGLPLGVLDTGEILRVDIHNGRISQADTKLIDRLQYFAR